MQMYKYLAIHGLKTHHICIILAGIFSWCSYCWRTQERTPGHWFSSANAWIPKMQKPALNSPHLRRQNTEAHSGVTQSGCIPVYPSDTSLYFHLLSSCSMLARLSRPLSHVSKAAWKSLWTIICSAAVSNMLNICVKEDESGGLQTEPKLWAGARLVELLMTVEFKTNTTENTVFLTFSSLVSTWMPVKSVWRFDLYTSFPQHFVYHATNLRTSWFEIVSQSGATVLSLTAAANHVAFSWKQRNHFFPTCKHVHGAECVCTSLSTEAF